MDVFSKTVNVSLSARRHDRLEERTQWALVVLKAGIEPLPSRALLSD